MKFKFFIRIWHFVNVYKPSHKKSHFSKKIGIFCKKIITFSSSAHLMKKSTFLQKFQFFWTKLAFFTKIDIDLSLCLKSLHDIILSLYSICPKTDAFCIKWYFLLKENATKNWHFSKTDDTSLRKLNISIKN